MKDEIESAILSTAAGKERFKWMGYAKSSLSRAVSSSLDYSHSGAIHIAFDLSSGHLKYSNRWGWRTT